MPAAVAAAEAQRHEPSTTAAPAQSTPSPPAPLQAALRANEAGPPAALNEEEHEAAAHMHNVPTTLTADYSNDNNVVS